MISTSVIVVVLLLGINLAAYLICQSNQQGVNLISMLRDCVDVKHPFKYARYGCWCGPFNTGRNEHVVDAIDKCCQLHDKCFVAALKAAGKNKLQALFIQYQFQCKDQVPICYGNTGVDQELCECDQEFALCVKTSDFQFSRSNLWIFNRPPGC